MTVNLAVPFVVALSVAIIEVLDLDDRDALDRLRREVILPATHQTSILLYQEYQEHQEYHLLL